VIASESGRTPRGTTADRTTSPARRDDEPASDGVGPARHQGRPPAFAVTCRLFFMTALGEPVDKVCRPPGRRRDLPSRSRVFPEEVLERIRVHPRSATATASCPSKTKNSTRSRSAIAPRRALRDSLDLRRCGRAAEAATWNSSPPPPRSSGAGFFRS